MLIVVNPYHLTTRELPALASALLARSAITVLPTPGDDTTREAFANAAAALPAYRAFVESWDWSRPLWQEGVLFASLEGADAIADVRAACRQIATDDRFAELRRFMRDDLFDPGPRGLELIARDIVKGGPDPGVCIPVAAGLDAFAARHSVVVARAAPSSVAQQAEARFATTLFRCSVPAFRQASPWTLLEARERLEAELDGFRDACEDAFDAALAQPSMGTRPDPAIQDAVRDAAHTYAAAFEAARADLLDVDEDDTHPIVAEVAIVAQLLPADAVLRSSRTAVRSLVKPRAPSPAAQTSAITVSEIPPCLSLVFRELGREPAGMVRGR